MTNIDDLPDLAENDHEDRWLIQIEERLTLEHRKRQGLAKHLFSPPSATTFIKKRQARIASPQRFPQRPPGLWETNGTLVRDIVILLTLYLICITVLMWFTLSWINAPGVVSHPPSGRPNLTRHPIPWTIPPESKRHTSRRPSLWTNIDTFSTEQPPCDR